MTCGSEPTTRLLDYYLCAAAAATGALFPQDRPPPDRDRAVPTGEVGLPELADLDAAAAWLHAERANSSPRVYPPPATAGRPTRLDLARARGPVAQITALMNLGEANLALERYEAGGECYRQAASLASAPQHRPLAAEAHRGTAMALVGLGRCADAVPLAEQAIEIMRDYGYPIRLVMMLDTLAQACRGSGRLSEAIDHLAEAVQLCRDFAGTHPAAQVLNTLGEPYGHAGDHLLARASHDEALELAEFASDRTERTRALVGLGEARSATSTAPGRCSRKRSTSTRRWAFRSPRGSGLGSLHLQ